MRGIFWVLVLSAVFTGLASADPYDVRHGVVIAHAPSGLVFSDGTDYCATYEPIAITSCEQQVNRIEAGTDYMVWYVLLAWSEPKYWAAFQFGLGDYDPAAYLISNHAMCNPPGGALVIETGPPGYPAWPEPNSGYSMAAQVRTEEGAWHGNYKPVYWFAGYAYSTDVITFREMPQTGLMSVVPLPGHMSYNEDVWDPATDAGAMGIMTDGVLVCPPTEVTGACCTNYGQTCTVMNQGDCVTSEGTFVGADTVCDPNPCIAQWGCCVYPACFMLSEEDCAGYGGNWHSGEICIAQGGTLDCGTPTDGVSWGSVKAAYR